MVWLCVQLIYIDIVQLIKRYCAIDVWILCNWCKDIVQLMYRYCIYFSSISLDDLCQGRDIKCSGIGDFCNNGWGFHWYLSLCEINIHFDQPLSSVRYNTGQVCSNEWWDQKHSNHLIWKPSSNVFLVRFWRKQPSFISEVYLEQDSYLRCACLIRVCNNASVVVFKSCRSKMICVSLGI